MALSHCSVENAMNKAVNKLGFSSVNIPQQIMVNEFIKRERCVCGSVYLFWENIVFYLPFHGSDTF